MTQDTVAGDESVEKIRIVLVDDQKVFLEGLAFVLESRTSDIEVLGTGISGYDAIRLAEIYEPDIILMDVCMPEMDGVEATRIIHAKYPRIKIVMFTTFDDDDYVRSAFQYGAIGYLLKNRPPLELINALRMVRDGTLQIDPAIASQLIRSGDKSTTNLEDLEQMIPKLTDREQQVLHLLAQELDNKQIAEYLAVSEPTVRNYVSSITW